MSDRLRTAAVLLPVFRDVEEELRIVLVVRADDGGQHGGQLGLPGGKPEPGDADLLATALREAEEEVGLRADRVEVLGLLPAYTTVTHFVVTPVVALATPPLDLALDGFEVAEAFEVPLAFLMTPANHRRHVFQFDGGQRQFISMPWGDHFIWGATAAMVRNLYRFLSS